MKRALYLFLTLTVLLAMVVLPVYAAVEHITDGADVLADHEEQMLEELAREVSDRIGADVHIVTMDDYTSFFGPGSIRKGAENYYTALGLGRGSEQEGILLALSFADRDYAMIFHGGQTLDVFSEDRQINLEEDFLDEFARNDWYGGMTDFLNGCAHEAQAHRTSMVALVLLAPLAVAAIACGVMVACMKSARRQTHADYYIPGGGVRVDVSHDRFINKTVVRRKIETSSSGGSGGRSGGFSGRSGKF